MHGLYPLFHRTLAFSDIGFLLSYTDDDCVIIKVGYAIDNQTSGFKAKENTGVLKPKMQCYLNRFLCA